MLEQSPSNATDVWCHVRAQESRGCMVDRVGETLQHWSGASDLSTLWC